MKPPDPVPDPSRGLPADPSHDRRQGTSDGPGRTSIWTGSLHRVAVLLRKELIQILHTRSLVGVLIVAPLVQLVVMGFAVTTDIKNITLAIRDNDHSYHSREYVRALQASGYFRTFSAPGVETGDQQLLVAGKAGLVLIIPRGFAANLLAGRPAGVQVLVDGADSNFAVHGLNYLQRASRLYSERMVKPLQERLTRARGLSLPAVVVQTRAWYNPEMISRYFFVPGLMGMLLLVTTMIVTSMALVKEREEGTMEQLIVTPLRPIEILAGKLLPFVVIGFIEITLALGIMFAVFRVPFHGSFALLYLASGVFLLTTLGLGLFISTLVHTQQQAMLAAMFFVMMPFILLSGFVFPVENMPRVIQYVAAVIPLKYYLIVIRGLFLKGTGLHDLWPPLLVLLVWGVAILGLASLKFHKRLD